ncbi:Rad9-domain-containing protein [Pisolithus marmoratus]|nr:Rad9-domain-containing protein [Pisolithus marmoratus]
MQATLSANALKPFARALSCLSRYGDDLVIHADAEYLSLSTTNSSLSAYCRFKYSKRFFSRYRVGNGVNRGQASSGTVVEEDTKGQIPTKTFLSILRHRTIEKTVERCELSIIEGPTQDDQGEPSEDEDSLESRLIVRFYCKLGIVKTHRLPLLIPSSLLSPGVPDSENESRLIIGPRAIRDITEHFPNGRGTKSDPQLVWTFGDTDVDVKSLESSLDSKGRIPLATELTISADEFDVYEVSSPPITIAFHLREFNATIAYGEAMSSPLELRFTDPAAPLFIGVEGDESECLFVISTSQIQGTLTDGQYTKTANHAANVGSSSRKRARPDIPTEDGQAVNYSEPRPADGAPRTEKVKKPARAALRSDVAPATGSRSTSTTSRTTSKADGNSDIMPPSFMTGGNALSQQNPSLNASQPMFDVSGDYDYDNMEMDLGANADPPSSNSRDRLREPLFYPSSSQTAPPLEPSSRCQAPQHQPRHNPLSQIPQSKKQDTWPIGLSAERVEDRPRAVFEGGNEVGLAGSAAPEDGDKRVESDERDSLELFEDHFGPTQEENCGVGRVFQPLFED